MLFSAEAPTDETTALSAMLCPHPALVVLLLLVVPLSSSVVVSQQVARSPDQPVVPAASATTTTTPVPTTTSTVALTTTTNAGVHLENAAIFGCRWPEDFMSRYVFCAKKAGVDVGNVTSELDVRYGVLGREILDEMLRDCTSTELTKCVKKMEKAKLDEFLKRWTANAHLYTAFEECLQSNTEAMNRLCGATTDVSRVVSGAAGLHLNLMNVLVRIKKEHDEAVNADKSISDKCMRKMAEAVHTTAALYIQSKHYMDNSVLCWNAVRQHCDAGCAAFASELNCLQAACPSLPVTVLQEFGIWQWYFMNAASTRQQCGVQQAQCSVSEDGQVKESMGAGSLLDAAVWRKKMREMAHSVEEGLGLPIQVVLAVVLAVIAAFCASCTALCAYKYGLCGNRTRVRRYTRLDDGERYGEGRSLTKAVDSEQ